MYDDNLKTGMEKGGYALFIIIVCSELWYWYQHLMPTFEHNIVCFSAALLVSYFLAFSRTAIPKARYEMLIRGVDKDKLIIFTAAEIATYAILFITVFHMFALLTLNSERNTYEKNESVIAAKMALDSSQAALDNFKFGYPLTTLNTAQQTVASLKSEKQQILQEQEIKNAAKIEAHEKKVANFWAKTWHCQYAGNNYSCTEKSSRQSTDFIMDRSCSPKNRMVTASEFLCKKWTALQAESPTLEVPKVQYLSLEIASLEAGPLKALRDRDILRANLYQAMSSYKDVLIAVGAGDLEENPYELMSSFIEVDKGAITSKTFSMLVNLLVVILMATYVWIYSYTSARMSLPVREELVISVEKESFTTIIKNTWHSILSYFKEKREASKEKEKVHEQYVKDDAVAATTINLKKSEPPAPAPVVASYQNGIGFTAKVSTAQVSTAYEQPALEYFSHLIASGATQNKAAKMTVNYFGLRSGNGSIMMSKAVKLGLL